MVIVASSILRLSREILNVTKLQSFSIRSMIKPEWLREVSNETLASSIDYGENHRRTPIYVHLKNEFRCIKFPNSSINVNYVDQVYKGPHRSNGSSISAQQFYKQPYLTFEHNMQNGRSSS